MIIETSDGDGTVIYRSDNGIPAEPEPPTPEVIAAQAISTEIPVRLDPACTIPEIKAAIIEGLDAAIISLGG